MKLRNMKKKEFVSFFGKEGYELLIPHDVNVLVVAGGEVPSFDISGYDACVSGYDFHDGKGEVLALIINPTKLLGELTPEQRLSERRFKFLQSFLVHELTHVKQHVAGRLSAKGDKMLWEGKEVDIPTVMSDYASTPWEVEAYAAQIAFAADLSIEQATVIHLENIASDLQQAA